MSGVLWDVVIIGAGASGLAAAERLSAGGRRVLVLESRDRIGGRIDTRRIPGWPVPIEAGAEFVHGHSAAAWDAIRASNLTTNEVSGRHWHAPAGRPEPLDFDRIWEPVAAELENVTEDDLPFVEFLHRHCPDLPATDREQVLAYCEGFNAADATRLSTRWLKESETVVGEESGAPSRLHDGYDRLTTWLRDRLDPATTELKLNTVVTDIHWQPGRVELTARSRGGIESYRGRAAIVTLPLGMLRTKPDPVKFYPDVVEKREAWSGLEMGAVVKVAILFREPFWSARTPDLGFLHTPGAPFQVWWPLRPVGSGALIGWAGGPAAVALSGLNERNVFDRALDQLARSFSIERERLTGLVADGKVFDWQTDPFARGAYSYVPVNGRRYVRQLAEPVAGALFFAGEATGDRFAGTVAGALASGTRAADELIGVE